MIRILDFDKLSDECDYLVKSTDIELICYGMYDEEYTSKSFKINSFLASNIVKANEDIYYSNRKESYYAYEINAKIVDLETKKVSLGELYILLDEKLPGDLKLGDYINFDVLRLDISFN
jgi:hypothetical protein